MKINLRQASVRARVVAALALVLFACLLMFTLGRGRTTRKRTMNRPTQIARVQIDAAKRIHFNGEAVTMEELRQRLAALKQAGGGVSLEAPSEAADLRRAVADEIFAVDLPLLMSRGK